MWLDLSFLSTITNHHCVEKLNQIQEFRDSINHEPRNGLTAARNAGDSSTAHI